MIASQGMGELGVYCQVPRSERTRFTRFGFFSGSEGGGADSLPGVITPWAMLRIMVSAGVIRCSSCVVGSQRGRSDARMRQWSERADQEEATMASMRRTSESGGQAGGGASA